MIEHITNVLYTHFTYEEASLLAGMIYGKDINRYSELYMMFKKVGLLHIVVLSGTNISLFLSLSSLLLSFLGRKASAFLSIVSVVVFIYLIGFEAPSARAVISASIQYLAVATGRKAYSLYALFFSAGVIFILKREWIQTLSFQLSYAASFGIIIFNNQHKKKENGSLLRNYIESELKIIFSAQLFTAPIILLYFREISLISPLANLLVSFTVGPIMLLGLFTSVCLLVNKYLAYIPAYFLHFFLDYVIFIARKLSGFSFAYVKL